MNARTNSTAVMARRLEPADSLDFFPTPPWATRAFCEHLLPRFEAIDPVTRKYGLTALDPACGEGHMALALREYFSLVTASDIHPYGFGDTGDFLHPSVTFAPRDWIITNPPFNLGADFVRRALELATRGVAMLVRSAFLEGENRYAELFATKPPSLIGQFIERVPMHRGRWVVNGSTATAYCWLVWQKPLAGWTRFAWIPKSRRPLERGDDWLRFSGCMDLPKEHGAIRLMEEAGIRRHLTLAELQEHLAKQERAVFGVGPAMASLADVRAALEARLL